MIEKGFSECQTSRNESKKRDDEKVDLCGTEPFNIQCKAVQSINLHTVLSEMPDESNYNLVFHKRDRKGEVVAMMKEDFYELLDMLIKNKIINA